MKKSLTTKILACICLFCFIMALFVTGIPFGGNTAQSNLAVSELFMPSDMKLTAATVAEGGESEEPGLLITSSSTDSYIQLKPSIMGEIAFTAEPIIKENSPTVKTMKITITDEDSGEYFNVIVNYGSVTSVSVEIDGEQAGLVYVSSKLKQLTNLANLSGTYTQYSSLMAPISFNSENMGVYVGEGSNAVLVWDMSKSQIDGRTVSKAYSGFESYTVKIAYTSFVGESASMLFYSLNGRALDKIVLDQAFAPQFISKFTTKGLVNSKYVIPTATVFDLYDGKLSSASVAVTYKGTDKVPAAEAVTVSNGTFTPTKAGNYAVTYSATNSHQVTGSKDYTVEVLESMPEYTTKMESDFPETAEVNDVVRIPQMTLYGGLLLSGEEIATVSVKRNGISQSNYQNVKSGFDFVCEKQGNYEFIYSAGDQTETYKLRVTASDQTVEFGYKFDTAYDIDTYIDLTEYKLLVNGQEVEYTVTITYPDDKVYSDRRFILSQTGAYKITIASIDGSKALTFNFSVFEQAKDLFSCNADGATVSYGTSSFTGRTGVYVNTKQSSTEIIYNQPIDISRYVNQTKEAVRNNEKQIVCGEDKVYIADDAIPLLEMSIEPNKYNSQVMRTFSVIITDAEDPTNSITVFVDSMNSNTWSYVRAKAGTQGYAGWLQNVQSGSKLYTEDHGFLLACSVAGQVNSSFTAEQSRLALYYDNEQKQILTYYGYDQNKSGQYNCIIADFDNQELSNGLSWGGFTSDKVYLKIVLGTIKSGNGGCHIYAVDGVSLTAEDLTYGAPRINVDMPELNGEEINLIGLKNQTFTIPTATAVDQKSDSVAVKTAVYFNNGQNKFNVSVTDGRFVPVRAGVYTIEYTAIDKFKNVATKTVEVSVSETYADMLVSAKEQVADAYKTGKTGSIVTLMSNDNLKVENSIGLYTISASVTLGTEAVKVTDGAFVPQKQGTYKVTYAVTDSVGRVNDQFEYEVVVELEQDPVIVSAIPEYVGFIRGNTYDIYDVFVVDYTQADLSEKKAEIYIKEGQSDFALYTAKTYQPAKIAEEAKDIEEVLEYVTIEYRYNGQAIEGLTYQIPVRNPYKTYTDGYWAKPDKDHPNFWWKEIDVTRFELGRYFLTDQNYDISFGTSIRFTANEQAEAVSTIRFIESLEPSQLLLGFKALGEAGQTNVKSLTVTLTDAADSSKTVQIKIVYENEQTKLYIGDTLTSGGFYGTLDNSTSDAFSFIFKNDEAALYDVKNERNTGLIEKFADGSAFSGFGDKVYVSYQVEKQDPTKSAGVEITNIGGQGFYSGLSDDETSPKLTINGKLGGNYEYQSTITIPSASATDVLSDVDQSSLTVSVKRVTADGEVVVSDINGTPLDKVSSAIEYTVKLDQTGAYKVYYAVKDVRSGAPVEETMSFTVVIKANPVITLNGSMPTTVKVNSTVKIPNYSVKFAQESEENTHYVIYVAPSDRHQYVSENTFVATEIGTYTVRIFALDVSGCYTLNEYQIKVTA